MTKNIFLIALIVLTANLVAAVAWNLGWIYLLIRVAVFSGAAWFWAKKTLISRGTVLTYSAMLGAFDQVFLKALVTLYHGGFSGEELTKLGMGFVGFLPIVLFISLLGFEIGTFGKRKKT